MIVRSFLLKPSKSLHFGWRSNYFRKNFVLILLIAFIPGIISGFGIYVFGVGKMEADLKKQHENQIQQSANNINDQLDYLEMSISHWAFEPRFGTSLSEINFVKEFIVTRDIKNFLIQLQGSHPLIKKVELYVKSNKQVLFTPNYNLVKDQIDIDFYESVLKRDTSISWMEQGEKADKNPDILLTHQLGGFSSLPFGSIIVTLDRSQLAQLLNTLTPYSEGTTFLFNENHILAENNRSKSPSIVNALKNEVAKKGKDNGSFTFEYEGERYSVLFGTQRRINSNWTYVSAVPLSVITAPLVFISKLIIGISAAGLLIAFIMSWFASNKIYRPVAKLVDLLDKGGVSEWPNHRGKDEFSIIEQQIKELSKDSEYLQEQLSAQIPQLKKSFLFQLIQGYFFNYSENQLRDSLKDYGWHLDDHHFIILDLKVSGILESENQSLNNDERLITLAVSNIMEDAAKEKFNQFSLIDFHDFTTGMLIVYPKSLDIQQNLNEYIQQLMEKIDRTIEMQVTVTISKPTDQVKRIPHIFEEVKQGSRFRHFKNHHQVINLREIKEGDKVHPIFYPFDIEKEIVQAIRMGEIQDVERLIEKFIEELTEKGIHEINIRPGILQLFSSIQHEIIHAGFHPYELFLGKNMYDELSQMQEPKLIVRWFTTKIITPFIQKLEERTDFEVKQLIDKVIQDIHKHYMKDISLESYADQVGTNPYTLSKDFKKIMGINFIDYITQLRIDKAKELLLKTDMKINDISEHVGYRQSYFNRIFKKQVGVPPSQYRKAR
jgi:AraC-like DNA-binding protein